MTSRALFLLMALALAGYATEATYPTAGTDPNADEINPEAFRAFWTISGEQVANDVANADEIEEDGEELPSIVGDVPGRPIVPVPIPRRCEDGPITVIFRQPGVWYWPAPTRKKCADRCPKGYQCVATKTVTRQFWTIRFKRFLCFGKFIWIPIGIRRLCLTDELKCECKPICKPLFCFPPRRFNPKICDCECPRISCHRPFELDPSSCQCRCPKNIVCRKPKILNFKTCKCVCPLIKCQPGYKVDPNTCRCVPICQKRCPPPSYLDPDACKCVGYCPDFNYNEYNCNAVDSCRDFRSYKCRWFPSFPHNRCQCECCQPKPGYENTDCGQWTPYGSFVCNFYSDPRSHRQACKWVCGH